LLVSFEIAAGPLLLIQIPPAAETFNPAASGSYDLALARVEGVALRAHLNPDVRFGGPGFKRLSTCTGYDGLFILRMYSGFHLLLHLTNQTGRATAYCSTGQPA